MNAEVTAENRPACGSSQHVFTLTSFTTHKYQGRVQIFVIFFHEFLVVIVGFPPVMFVELRAKVVLIWRQVRFFTVRRFNVQRRLNEMLDGSHLSIGRTFCSPFQFPSSVDLPPGSPLKSKVRGV